jgi:hypothetical protein
MSKKTGAPVAKLREIAKRKAMAFRMGTIKPIITRTASTYHEKRIAYDAHRRAIHGTYNVKGVMVERGGRNPIAAETFHGDGLPSEGYVLNAEGKFETHAPKAPKTAAERAKADKRNSIASESRATFKPRPFGAKRFGCVSGSYLAK